MPVYKEGLVFYGINRKDAAAQAITEGLIKKDSPDINFIFDSVNPDQGDDDRGGAFPSIKGLTPVQNRQIYSIIASKADLNNKYLKDE